MIKKRKISMRTRRRIFYSVCVIVILSIIVIAVQNCSKGCEPSAEPVTEPTNEKRIPQPAEVKARNERYADVEITPSELDEMASIIYLEARNQSAAGQQAVAEVILNRVINDGFPNTITEVIHQGESSGVLQFTTVQILHTAKPTIEQYRAINEALYGDNILPSDVVFFSRKGENDRVWGTIDDHVFCYEYDWE